MTNFVTSNRREVAVWATFALILLVGAAFRFQALNWDQGQFFHPDERAIIYDYGSQGGVQGINTVPLPISDERARAGIYRPDRVPVNFPPNGLSFFIPNEASNLRPATEEETRFYFEARLAGQSYKLPSNVLPPDQPVPEKAINFWNGKFSPLNPRFFAYGTFPMYLIKLGGHIMSGVTGQPWTDLERLTLVGRFLSGLWSMGTLLLVFLLARVMFQPGLGAARANAIALLAAAFQAVAVLDIQLAHYASFDVALTFFIVLSLYMAVRLMRSGHWLNAAGVGAAIGLGLACKISAAPVVLSAVVAAVLYGLYGAAASSGEYLNAKPRLRSWPGREEELYGQDSIALGPRLIRGTLLNLVIAGLVALIVWFVAMPYAFLDFTSWSKRVIEEAGMSRGMENFPYTRQYVGTIPFLYQGGNLVQYALGLPLGLLGLAGLVYSLGQVVRRGLKAELILLSFLLPYSLVTFSAEAKFNRYLLPVLPLLVLLAARLVVQLAAPLAYKHTTRLAASGFRKFPVRTYLMSGVALFAFGWASLWAIAFSQIYSTEHTMNQATRWMFQNMPNGVSFSNEYWDEALPTRITGESPAGRGWCDKEVLDQNGGCESVRMDLYGDAPNDVKADYFVQQVRKTDYITIASNRLYATMPRLPWRYPVQIRFYELLFSGKLGYDKVGEFSSYPRLPLLNWQFNDDEADESFTVYDHPKVLIFKKTRPLTDDEVRGLFSRAAKAPQIVKRYPGPNDLPVREAGQGDGALDSATAGQVRDQGKTLLLNKPVDRLPVIDDYRWNSLANDNQWLAVILWYLLFQLLGVVALPVAWRVCRRLPDRGYILSKPLGAVVVALVIWIMVWTRLVMNTAITAWAALLVLAGFSAWLWWHNRVELTGWLAAHRYIIAVEEILFAGVFVAWMLFRLGNPDLWHPFFGGEKPMEMTHLQGILKSAYFPPYDPWFSDGYINYYYWGQYLVSTWIKLSGISPYIAFNLAIPVLYTFTCTGAFSLVYNLALKYKRYRAQHDQTANPEQVNGPIYAGLFGVVIFAVIGNLDGFIQLLQRFKPVADLANNLKLYPDVVEPLKKFDYFRSSRVIPGTINEFPAFSFIYSDLHAHLIALPYTLIAMAIGLNLLSADWTGHTELRPDGRRDLVQMTAGRLWRVLDRTLVTLVIAMIVIGFLGATNSWDLPTYLLVINAGVFMGLFRRYFSGEPGVRLTLPSLAIDLGLTVVTLGATLLGGLGLYWNFFSNFQAFFTKIAVLPDRLPTYSYQNEEITTISARTELHYFLIIFLLPLLLVLSYLLWNLWDWGRGIRARRSLQPLPGSYPAEAIEEEPALAPEPARQPQAVRRSLTGGWSVRRSRPTLALSMSGAGADGGQNSGFGSGGFMAGPGWNTTGGAGGLAKFWLAALAALGVFTLGVGLAAPNNWLVFALAVTIMAACLVLTFVRPFDRRLSHRLEALQESSMFLRVMLLGAFGIVAATEIVYLQDDMGGEYTRMNTIFKFYYQVWALMALAGAFGTYVVWTRWVAGRRAEPGWRQGRWRQVRRFAWIGAIALLVFVGGLYPAQAIPTRLADRGGDPSPPLTLDGRAYYRTMKPGVGVPNMPGKVFDHTYEAQSLFEFYDKIKGTPVILQATIWPYRGGGSWIPINTGLPTVLGWDHHSRQQRWPGMVNLRNVRGSKSGYIREIYNTPSIEEALELLNRYHVTYVHIGTIERDAEFAEDVDGPGGPYMSEEGYAKFEQMARLGLLDIAYQNPGVIVYKLTARGESGVISGNLGAGGVVSVSDPKLRRLEEAIKAQPNNPQAYYNLGQYYISRRQYDKAAAALETVIRLEPNRVNPYHVLGDIYRDAGDRNKALEQYRKATIVAAPTEEMPAAFNKYGVELLQAGRYEEALKQLDEVLKLNKKFNEAYYHRGEVLEALGRKEAAIEAYQQTIVNSQRREDFWNQRANQKIRELAGK